MSLMHLLILFVVAAIIGSLAQAIVGYSHGGCVVSAVLGFIGAVLGVWLASMLKAPELWVWEVAGQRIPIIWSIIGATLFVAILQAFVRKGNDGGGLG